MDFFSKFKAGAEAAAKALNQNHPNLMARGKGYIEQGKGYMEQGKEKATNFINTTKENNPNFMARGNEYIERSKGMINNYLPKEITTKTLTKQNFKEEIKNLKENLSIELKNYNIVDPDIIECLIKNPNYVTVYGRDPDIKMTMLWDSHKWKNFNMADRFYKNLSLQKFDDFQKPEITFNDFKMRMRLHGNLQLKIELTDTFKREYKSDSFSCNPPKPSVIPRSGGRRRSSRKNYRKSVQRVKSAKRASRSRSRSRSRSGTRKYRTRK